MGASEWIEIVPYEQDIENALYKCRAMVYEELRPHYSKAERIADLEEQIRDVETGAYDPGEEDIKDWIIEDASRKLQQLRALPEPTTVEAGIKEILLIAAEEGTGSILDVNPYLTETPGYNTFSPLSESELLSLFGTTQPTRKMIEESSEVHELGRGRGVGTYIILYEAGQPSEIYFTGYSGD